MNLADFVESTRFINFARALDVMAPFVTGLLILLLIVRELAEVSLASQEKRVVRLLNIGLLPPIALTFLVIFVVKVLLTFV